MREPPSTATAVVAGTLVALATLAAMAPILGNGFISYDDRLYVTGNPDVRDGLTWQGLRWAFTTGEAANWHPLTWLSHMADWQVFGDRAWGHHLMSLLLHLANALLLFHVLRRMTGSTGPSAFVAALFGAHPLHVESVAWVAERKDVLSTLFWMLALAAYARYARAPKLRRYVPVLVLVVLGLAAKPMLVTLPLVLLLLDYWPLGRWRTAGIGRLVAEKVPLLALSAASSVVTLVVQRRGGAMSSLEVFPIGVRAANAVVAYGAYLWKTVWPSSLAFLYPHSARIPPLWQIAAAALVLVAVSVLAARERRRRPYLLVGWLWYLGTLVPVIGLVQVGVQGMADRYTYVPLIGAFVIVAWGGAELLSVARGQGSRVGRAAGFAVLAALVPLIVRSQLQARCWRDSQTLYLHALRVTRDNVHVMNMMGATLAGDRRFEDAIPWYERALETRPAFTRARNNLGLALVHTGRLDEAARQLEEAIRIDPEAPEPRASLGIALARLGRPAEAKVRFEEALRLKPDYAEAITHLGSLLVASGSVAAGMERYREALRLDPRCVEALDKLGLALAMQGRLGEAFECLDAAVRIQPDYAEAHQNLAMAHYLAGEYAEAWESVRRARRLGLPPQRSLLDLLAARMPEPKEHPGDSSQSP